MIHFFEGFWWPNTTPAAHVDSTESLCLLDLGPASAGNYLLGGGGLFGHGTSQLRTMSTYNAVVPARPKLSIGMRVSAIAVAGNNGFFSITPIDAATSVPFLNNASYSASSGQGLLPTFQVTLGLTVGSVSLRDGHQGTTLFAEALPGHTYTALNYYEAVYDFEQNKIEVFVNDILIGTLPYVFSEAQKTKNLKLVQGLGTFYSSAANYCRPQLHSIVVADEKIGPTQVKGKFATTDAQVDPSFGAGPYAPRVNYSSDGTRKITTTESLSKAMFANAVPASGEILGVNFRGRFSTTEQSALEALGAAKLTLESQGQYVQRDAVSIPKLDRTRDDWYLPVSPFTGTQWTAEELNSMTFGAEIVVDPKPVS